jgi:hypothetical protein
VLGDCSDTYNVLHRYWYGTDSPCKQKELEDALVRAGESRERARQQVVEHQNQMRSASFMDAGKKGLFVFLFGAGVALVVWYALEHTPRK